MRFYSYIWTRENETPYYAGKGSGNRAFISFGHSVHCPKDKSRIVVFPMLNEAEAFESEIALIALFGRKDNKTGILHNHTDGGDGVSGHSHSEETKARIGNASRGNKHALGYRHSPETKARMSASRKGKPLSIEHRAALIGRVFSDETRDKLRTVKKGRKLSSEHKAKLSVAHTGKILSLEHKLNIGRAVRRSKQNSVIEIKEI
jgi:hypothetical protein